MGIAETAELAVRISLKDNASAGIRGLQRNLSGLSGSVARVGRGFGQIGTGLARAGLIVGGAAVTGLTAVAKAAVDFEDAFAGVRKTVDEADLRAVGLDFDKLAQQFRDMATEIPIAATELAAIGETAGALGIKAQDIETFTRTVALLGETTNLSTDAASEALGKLGTILGLTGQDFTDFADVLVNLGNQGASTEAEIIEVAKRFGAIGRQAGLSTDQILALSSSITSLGAEPEAGGSALSRIFANMATEIANGTEKGQTFAKVTGDSLAELGRRINQGDALGILMDTLEGLQGLSRTESASILKALGITNVRDRNAIVNMANNLAFVNEQLEIAKESEGALWKEAEKRFATTASKIQLVKNNLIETGITIGNEMLPAIGRALDKALAVLRDPKTKAEASALGKDIGKFIDSIDWDKVIEGVKALGSAMKVAAEFAMTVLSVLDKLPNEIKGAALGFLALNKLSGGLIGAGAGNVIGGLAGAITQGLASRAPGVGRLFAQPVFVTNWPIGFGPGAMGPGGRTGGRFGGLLGALGGAFTALFVAQMADEFHDEITGLGEDLGKGWREAVKNELGISIPTIDVDELEWPLGPKNAPDWAKFAPSTPQFVQGQRGPVTRAPALTPSSWRGPGTTRELRGFGLVEKKRDKVDWAAIAAAQKTTNTKIDTTNERLSLNRASMESLLSGVTNAEAMSASKLTTSIEKTKASIDWQGMQTRSAVTTGTNRTVETIRANRPVVRVNVNTNVRVDQTIVRRSYTTSTQTNRTSGPTEYDW